jgi:small conductance mechanosensitive channel
MKAKSVALTATATLVLAGAVLAQTPTAEDGLLSRIESHIAQVENLKQEARESLEAAREVEGDDRLVRHLRTARTRMKVRSALSELAGMVTDARDKGADLGDISGRVETLLERAGAALIDEIRDLESEISRQREEGSGLEPAKMPAMEERLDDYEDWLDATFVALDQNLRDRGRLNIEASAAQAQLDSLLEERADYLSGHLDLAVARLNQLKDSGVDPVSADTDADSKAEYRTMVIRRDNCIESLGKITGLMRQRGLETSVYREQLIRVTGEITTDVFNPAVARGLAARAWEHFVGEVIRQGPRLVFKTLVLVFILFLAWLAARVIRRIVRSMVTRSKLAFSQLLQDFVIATASRLVWLVGILIALSQMGLEVGPILAGLGVAGFIVGFALQDTLSNFAAGLMILLYRPFDVGDTVEAGGVFGNVRAMSLVNTTIVTFDNQVKIVPNTKIWGEVINNVTAEDIRRVDMVFGISYDDDIREADAIFHRLCDEHPKVLDDPKPLIHVHKLNDSSVDFIVRPWTKTDDYWSVYWSMTRNVKLALDEAGITIPFPQRTVHHQSPPPAPDVVGARTAPPTGAPPAIDDEPQI